MNNRGSNRSKKGQMPMALVAVALLISGSFFCIVTKNIEDSTDNSLSLYDEMEALDDEIERTRMHIETELGTLVSDLTMSSNDDLAHDHGTSTEASKDLLDISDAFDEQCSMMFDEEFPSYNRGVTATVTNHDVWLTIESIRFGTSDSDVYDTKSAFLRATGTVTVNFATESSNTVRTLEVTADATSCLPMIVESATEFELSLEGPNSALAQMVDYQLSAIAQNRIMNGYGMMNKDGYRSTSQILTEKDVKNAVRNALDILETMHFRSNGSDNQDLLTRDRIDIAEYILVENGKIEFDLGAFYAQAIYSNIDQYVLSWIGYLEADKVLDFIDGMKDFTRNMWHGFVNIFRDEDIEVDKTRAAIRDNMSSIGASDDLVLSFDHPFLLTVDDITFTYYVDEEPITTTIDGMSRMVDAADRDVTDWNGWGDFYKKYHKDTNSMYQPLENVLRSIVNEIGGSCRITIVVDCFDQVSYIESIRAAVGLVISQSERFLLDCINSGSKNCKVTDPFMSAAKRCIEENRYDVFDLNGFEDRIDRAIDSIVREIVSGNPDLAQYADRIREMVSRNCNADDIVNAYRKGIEEQVNALESMNRVVTENNGKILSVLGFALREILKVTELNRVVEDKMEYLLDRMSEYIESKPDFDVTELPNETSFRMMDGYETNYNDPDTGASVKGKPYEEVLTVDDVTSLEVTIVGPDDNESKNMHYIGFDNWDDMAYSAVFTVHISGWVDYVIRSTNTLTDALGSYDATYRGHTQIDLELDVFCITGWGLAGVDYRKSNTLYNDMWMMFFDLIRPILDDLMTIFRAVKNMERLCGSIMLEFGNRLNEMINRIYEIVSIPLEMLQSVLERYLNDLMENIGLESLCIRYSGQTFTFKVFDMTVVIDTTLHQIFKSQKHIVKVTVYKEVNGYQTYAFCDIGKRNERDFTILAGGGAEGEDWRFNIDFDPLQNSRPYLVTINGNVRDVEYFGTMPEHSEYKRYEIALSDVPAIGTMLSNIITPIPGVKCAIDAGAYLKCKHPVKDGLVINEVEQNPSGNDSGNEWIELYNNSDTTIDLDGYVIHSKTKKDSFKTETLEDMSIGPREYLVITFKGQFLNNEDMWLELYDSNGVLIDDTPKLTDGNNNGFTNQRCTDAYADWGMNESSGGDTNGSNFACNTFLASTLTSSLIDIVPEVLDEMGGEITTSEQLMEFIERILAKYVESIINKVASFLVEAYLFIDLAFQDLTSTGNLGMRIMLGIDSDIVKDTLRMIASMIPMIGEHISNPMGMSAERILLDDVYIRLVTYFGISAPKFMNLMGDPETVEAGLSVKFNLSAASKLLDMDRDDCRWSAEAGIVLEGVPAKGIPPCFKANEIYDHDLWLIRMTFSRMMVEAA